MISDPLLNVKDLENSKNSMGLVQIFRTNVADQHTPECDIGKDF